MTFFRALARVAACLLLAAAAWGCAPHEFRHEVALIYQGPASTRVAEPATAPREIVLTPFADHRKDKRLIGVYRVQTDSYTLLTKGGTASDAVTAMAREYLRRAGLRPVAGKWDGEAYSLRELPADYALYGEIVRMDFSGRGSVPSAKNRGSVVLELRLGIRQSRKVIRRKVEVDPDDYQFTLFNFGYEHLAHVDQIIQRAVNRAIDEGLSDLIRRIRP